MTHEKEGSDELGPGFYAWMEFLFIVSQKSH